MAKIIWESEKELEDWLYEFGVSNNTCAITGMHIDSIYRQVDFGSYGIADLLSFSYAPNGNLEVAIIEVKKEVIDVKTFAQLARYRSAFRAYMDAKLPNQEYSISLIAVSSNINMSDDSIWLSDLLTDYCDFYAYLCVFDLENGIIFSQKNAWVKNGEEFGKFHSSIGMAESVMCSEYASACAARLDAPEEQNVTEEAQQ